jgi:hypothetical protein
MAAVCQPTTQGNRRDLQARAAQEAILHFWRLRLRHLGKLVGMMRGTRVMNGSKRSSWRADRSAPCRDRYSFAPDRYSQGGGHVRSRALYPISTFAPGRTICSNEADGSTLISYFQHRRVHAACSLDMTFDGTHPRVSEHRHRGLRGNGKPLQRFVPFTSFPQSASNPTRDPHSWMAVGGKTGSFPPRSWSFGAAGLQMPMEVFRRFGRRKRCVGDWLVRTLPAAAAAHT